MKTMKLLIQDVVRFLVCNSDHLCNDNKWIFVCEDNHFGPDCLKLDRALG